MSLFIKILGRTGLRVFSVGFGTGGLGTSSNQDLFDIYVSKKAYVMSVGLGSDVLASGLEAMINLLKSRGYLEGDARIIVDTAQLYGGRMIECIVGLVLRERAEFKPWVLATTKVGQTLFSGVNYDLSVVLRELDHSQSIIGIDRFEIIYLHDPMTVEDAVVYRLRDELEKRSVADFIGLAANNPATTEKLLASGVFPVAVVPEACSLINSRIENKIIPLAAEHNIGLVAATVIERGLLTDNPAPGEMIGRTYTQDCIDYIKDLRDMCLARGGSLSGAALQWPTMTYPEVSCSIFGPQTKAQVHEAISSLDLVSTELMREIQKKATHFEGQRYF